MDDDLKEYEDLELVEELYERRLKDNFEDDIYGVSDHKGTMYIVSIKAVKDFIKNPFRGMTQRVVEEILWLKNNTDMKYKEISELYNVDEYIVCKIGVSIEDSISPEKPMWYEQWEHEHGNV